MKKPILLFMATIAMTSNSYAVLSWLNPSWSGDGTIISPAPSPGTFVNGTPSSAVSENFVTAFSSGTITHGQLLETPGTRLLTDPVTATSMITLTGGTGTLQLGNTTSFDGSTSQWNNYSLTNLVGVTGISITVNASDFLAGRTATVGSFAAGPLIAALGLINPGTGAANTDFTVTAEYSNVFRDIGMGFSEMAVGAPSASPAFDTISPSNTLLTANNGFTGTVTQDGAGLVGDFLLIEGFDNNSDGFNGADTNSHYSDTLTFTITPDAGTFASDAQIVVSLDGQQYSNVTSVPEPSVGLLLGLIGGISLLRRRR